MPRSGWTASADSFEPINPATNVLDGGVGCALWHTTYSATTAPLPHWLVVDMKTPRVVGGFRYLPRQDGSTNGTIGQYRFSISADGSAWRQVAAGDFSQWQTGTAAKTIVLGNVAAGKPATQSSGDPATAARAVDGNPSGTLADGSVALTAAQAAPWWQVDLGAVHTLNTIRLWNRGDCCADQLADVTVFVSRTDMTGRSLASLAADPAVWRYQVVGRAGRETLIRGNAHGRSCASRSPAPTRWRSPKSRPTARSTKAARRSSTIRATSSASAARQSPSPCRPATLAVARCGSLPATCRKGCRSIRGRA